MKLLAKFYLESYSRSIGYEFHREGNNIYMGNSYHKIFRVVPHAYKDYLVILNNFGVPIIKVQNGILSNTLYDLKKYCGEEVDANFVEDYFNKLQLVNKLCL